MVRVSYNQKPYRRAFMETFGARCIPSPSTETNFGRQVLAASPDSNGSLGIAISEAVEIAADGSSPLLEAVVAKNVSVAAAEWVV